jgi:hypothetical protein
MENYTNSEMTDMVLCYGSADGVSLRAQALYREKFPARRVPGKWYFSIAFVSKSFVSDLNVRRSTSFYANSLVNGVFNTHIHQRKSRTMQQVLQGFWTIYIEGHRRVLQITTDILNIVSNNYCKYGSCGFCFDFSFHLVFTLNLTRFCGCVFIVYCMSRVENERFWLKQTSVKSNFQHVVYTIFFRRPQKKKR